MRQLSKPRLLILACLITVAGVAIYRRRPDPDAQTIRRAVDRALAIDGPAGVDSQTFAAARAVDDLCTGELRSPARSILVVVHPSAERVIVFVDLRKGARILERPDRPATMPHEAGPAPQLVRGLPAAILQALPGVRSAQVELRLDGHVRLHMAIEFQANDPHPHSVVLTERSDPLDLEPGLPAPESVFR